MHALRSILTVFAAGLLIRPSGAQTIDPVPSKYHLSPDKADADKAFVLTTLNPDLPCDLAYYGQNVSVNGDRINLTFRDSVATSRTGKACPGENGPVFPIPALKQGLYQVYVAPLINCPGGTLCLPVIIPQFAGTLNAGGVAALAPAASASGPSLSLHSGRMELRLPDPGGRWRAEILEPAGRRAQSFSGWSPGGETLRLPLDPGLARGLYWVRLEAAGTGAWTGRVLITDD